MNDEITLICPGCGFEFAPSTTSDTAPRCPQCGKGVMPHHELQAWARLEWEGGNVAAIDQDAMTIGRNSPENPSDIEIEDPYASRRSLLLKSFPPASNSGRPIMEVAVLNTKNPVFVNQQQLNTGDTAELNHGDTITIGMTKMSFWFNS